MPKKDRFEFADVDELIEHLKEMVIEINNASTTIEFELGRLTEKLAKLEEE